MARQILILLLLLMPFSFYGQQSLLNQDRLWTMVEVHCLPQGNAYSSHYLKIGGDTIIGGTAYKKLDWSKDETQTEWFEYGGYIRETEDGKVYYYRTGLDEGLIYDFGAAVGDTVAVLNYELIPDTLRMVVLGVDSVLLEDGWHRRMVLEDDSYPGEESWIEGVGSISGIVKSCLSAFGSSCGGYELLCTSDGGSNVFVNPDYPGCWYVSTRIDNLPDQSELKIYPNPVRDVLTVVFEELAPGKTATVIITDFSGRIVKDVTLQPSGIDMSDLRKGMYFIQLNTGNSLYTGKVLKH